MRIGFIGLGDMGMPMARRLLSCGLIGLFESLSSEASA